MKLDSPETLKYMDPCDVAWLAGILEGEGSWVRKGKDRVSVQVAMTDRDIVYRLRKITGVGNIFGPYKREAHHKELWVWSVGAINHARDVTDKVLPYLGQRRKAKAVKLFGTWE